MKAAALMILLLLSTLPAHADELQLRNGSTFTGRVREDGAQVRIEMEFGTMTFSKVDVRSITRSQDPLTVYEEKSRKAASVQELLDLAAWARTKDLPGKANETYSRVLKLDPDQVDARKALGYVHEQGQGMQSAPSPVVVSLEARKLDQSETEQKNRLEIERTRLSLDRQRIDDEKKLRELELQVELERARRQDPGSRYDLYDSYGGRSPWYFSADPPPPSAAAPAPAAPARKANDPVDSRTRYEPIPNGGGSSGGIRIIRR